ncbi:hypothetical protein [Paenibacillus pedocola]|uniref:hypothetical protein n=1 Tax=Paenibacillus pedocola TaxID=3242193 RepID=UPI0028779400|nr:hypothetical protein [Paenibacillus typhae]
MKVLPDFSDWIVLPDVAVSGVTRKLWLTKDTKKALFKFGDEWTEEIASNLAEIIKIPCMDATFGM